MKHPWTPTITLVVLFIASQLIGISLLALDTQIGVDEQGNTLVENSEPITGPRPTTTGAGTFVYLVIGIGLGTAILLLLAKFRAKRLWKYWYMFAIAITSATALGVVLSAALAITIGIVLAILKAYKPQLLMHNITEILIHTGIALILVPILDVFWASMMLIAIAVYDAYAVWKSKHMVKLATFMTDSQLFAGLHIPYSQKNTPTTKAPSKIKTTTKKTGKSAILGGGDIAFPLLFSGVVFQWILTQGISKQAALGLTSIITVCAAIGLSVLFSLAKKDQFYPAMPFISTACFVGLGIIVVLI